MDNIAFKTFLWIFVFFFHGIFMCMSQILNYSQNITVQENTEANTRVGVLGKNFRSGEGNGDKTVSGPFIVHASPDTTEVFKIDSESGIITTKKKIQGSKQPTYYLIAFTSSAQIDLTIYIISSNFQPPIFRPPSFNATILIDVTSFFVASVADPNKGEVVQSCQIITDSFFNFPFSLKTTRSPSNALTVELVLNRVSNLKESYSFLIRAYDNSTNSLYTDLPVSIDLSLNQKPNVSTPQVPVFSELKYQTEVVENADLNTNLLHVKATLPGNQSVTYSIETETSEFGIDSKTGWIFNKEYLSASKSPYLFVVSSRKTTINDHLNLQKSTTIVTVLVKRSAPVEIILIFLSEDGSAKIPRKAILNDPVAYVLLEGVDENYAFKVWLEGGDGYFGVRKSGSLVYLMVVANSLSSARFSYLMSFYFAYIAHLDQFVSRNFTVRLVESAGDYGKHPTFEQPIYFLTLPSFAKLGSVLIQPRLVFPFVEQIQKHQLDDFPLINQINKHSSNDKEAAKELLSWRYQLNQNSFYERFFDVEAETGRLRTSSLISCLFPSKFSLRLEAFRAPAILDAASNNLPNVTCLIEVSIQPNSSILPPPIFPQSFYQFQFIKPGEETLCFGQVALIFFC